MHACSWDRCDQPATKCVIVTGDFADTIWLCDEHYDDPKIKAAWDEAGFTWEC